MTSLLILALAAGMVAPPGQVFTGCRTDLFGITHFELANPADRTDSIVELGGEWGITVNMGNVDADPELEIGLRVAKLAGSSYISRLVMLDDDLLELWSREIGDVGNVEVAGFTFADLNGDGKDEVLFPLTDVYFNTYPQYKARVYALDGQTGQDLLGWPYILPGWPEDPYLRPYSELVVADLNNDGTKEVLCEVTDNNSIRKCGSALYCFSATGDSLWKYWFYQDTLDRHGQWTKPAVADLDGDRKMEIICHEAKFNGQNPWNLLERRLFILNHDGTLRKQIRTEGPGSSFTPDYAPPVVADMNQDGDWEIVILRRPGFLEVIDTSLARLPGFPVDLTADAGYIDPLFTRCFSTPAVADLDMDSDLEVVVGSFGLVASGGDWGGNIHAFHHNGTALDGFPHVTRNGVWYSPALADVDSVPGPEILTAACDSAFYVVSASGESLPGWPRRGFGTYWLPDQGSHGFIEGRIPMSKTPHLCDIDSDSLVELTMTGTDGRFYAWNTAGRYDPSQLPLPTFHYDKWRTGWYRLSPVGIEDRAARLSHGNLPTIVRGAINLPPSPDAVNTRLFDMTGRPVAALRPGGNDVRSISPGVYFVRSRSSVRKVVIQN